MQLKLLNESDGDRTYAVVLSTGESITKPILDFARTEHLRASQLTAIGALSEATLGYYDLEAKQYHEIPVREQVEVLSFIGDISLKEDGEPQLHAHLVVGKRDGSTMGGHLLDAKVRPTLEIIVRESPSYLQRQHDEASGLGLIQL